MSMDFLYKIPDTEVFFFMVIITVVSSLLLIILNKFFIFYKLRYKDNTTTASIASLIGIIYGVLAGFLCLYLLNNQTLASNAAVSEGIAAANIYRESRWLDQPLQNNIQTQLKIYLENVINIEWPAMSAGQNVEKGNSDEIYINKMSDSIITYPIQNRNDFIKVNDIISEIKALYKARQQRLEISQTELTPEIWEVILVSTILIIVINYAFRVNFYLHVFSLTAFSIMAAAILFLLVTLDRPYQGEFIVEPDALKFVLKMMHQDGKPLPAT